MGELIGKDGKIYFIYPDGTLAMDWVQIGNDWFFFSPYDGSMAIDTVINGFVFGKDGKFTGIDTGTPVNSDQQLKEVVNHILSVIIQPYRRENMP